MEKTKMRKKCKEAIDNIIKEGITDVEIFADFLEINYLKEEKFRNRVVDEVVKRIENAVENPLKSLNSLKLRKSGSVLVPKKNLSDFRRCALIDVFDEIIYLTLVLYLAEKIEKSKIKKSENVVYSYRYNPEQGYLFDREYNYTAFRNAVSRASRKDENKIMIECDISNFYDRLNLHRLESNLLSIYGIDKKIVAIINQVLLYWANRDSYGLPVGSNASRILAEAALIEVDKYLVSKGVNFIRFVDDYRIFATDAVTAFKHLTLLIERLNLEGLFLNTSKTKIQDISDKLEYAIEDDTVSNIQCVEDDHNRNENIEEINNAINKAKIIRGYSGVIPFKFRKLTENQIKSLLRVDIGTMLEKLSTKVIVKPEEITEMVRSIVAQRKWGEFDKTLPILSKFPQFIPYFSDMTIKHLEQIPDKTLKSITQQFTKWFTEEDTPEYILIYLVRFFASTESNNKEVMINYFRGLRRNSGDYIGRALLESFGNKLSRNEILEVRKYYERADVLEKRQIIMMIIKNMHKEERTPFFKDIKFINNDIFIDYLINDINNKG
ncbi:RNA-directed DNA polymerase [Bacillus mobilis]|uniref:RNA-directed DNA polymerase n=2 Tax=Bacteria TaxID=2 RepID=UPI0022E1A0E0|nr:RNA-directed DNA polymerase [Bacillus mobilis]